MELNRYGNLSGYELHRLNGFRGFAGGTDDAEWASGAAQADIATKTQAQVAGGKTETSTTTEAPKVAPNNKMLYLGIGGALVLGVAAYFIFKDDEKVTVKPKRR